MYPLQFEPTYRDYLWGGRRLETALGKQLPPGPHWAESWEVVDHGEAQSVISNGPLQGLTLGALNASSGRELLGRAHPQSRFPLLFKFLDCCQNLSVQVHPNNDQASKLVPPDRGKTEAWVILDCAPGARLYAGLREGVDLAGFEQCLRSGGVLQCMHEIRPRAGDCIFVPAGAPHALGQGLLVAEIQQASNTTYRLYDWDRVDDDGHPRALHIDQGLASTDFSLGPLGVQPIETLEAGIERLAICDYFELQRWRGPRERTVGGDGRSWILAVLQGTAELASPRVAGPLGRGQTVLVPAAISVKLTMSDEATLLAMTTG